MNAVMERIMTLDEAIAHCKEAAESTGTPCSNQHSQLGKWLAELMKYRQIGTLEECREAREKQQKKEPYYEGDGYADGEIVYDTWVCPCCGKHYEVDYDDYDYCPECGQAIDLSEVQK